MSSKIVRSGWLQRESSILKRWKANWFVLYHSGVLVYFETQNTTEPEGRVVMSTECRHVLSGSQVSGVTPPSDRCQGCLIRLQLESDNELTVCAKTTQDMKLWRMAFDAARLPQRKASASGATSPSKQGATTSPSGNTQPPKAKDRSKGPMLRGLSLRVPLFSKKKGEKRRHSLF